MNFHNYESMIQTHPMHFIFIDQASNEFPSLSLDKNFRKYLGTPERQAGRTDWLLAVATRMHACMDSMDSMDYMHASLAPLRSMETSRFA